MTSQWHYRVVRSLVVSGSFHCWWLVKVIEICVLEVCGLDWERPLEVDSVIGVTNGQSCMSISSIFFGLCVICDLGGSTVLFCGHLTCGDTRHVVTLHRRWYLTSGDIWQAVTLDIHVVMLAMRWPLTCHFTCHGVTLAMRWLLTCGYTWH